MSRLSPPTLPACLPLLPGGRNFCKITTRCRTKISFCQWILVALPLRLNYWKSGIFYTERAGKNLIWLWSKKIWYDFVSKLAIKAKNSNNFLMVNLFMLTNISFLTPLKIPIRLWGIFSVLLNFFSQIVREIKEKPGNIDAYTLTGHMALNVTPLWRFMRFTSKKKLFVGTPYGWSGHSNKVGNLKQVPTFFWQKFRGSCLCRGKIRWYLCRLKGGYRVKLKFLKCKDSDCILKQTKTHQLFAWIRY